MSKLEDVVIFEYEVDWKGIPINTFDVLEHKLSELRNALPDNIVIALPSTIKLKSIDDADLADINNDKLIEAIENMEIE